MSHFLTIVLTNKNFETEKADDIVEELLAPYSEHIEVEEYNRECCCIGEKARLEITKQINEELGTWHDARNEFYCKYPWIEKLNRESNKQKEAEELYKEEVVKPRETRQKELIAITPGLDDPNPECSICNGTGMYKTTYNPDSQWDWWVIGGRWAGCFNGKDIAKVTNVDWDDPPFAIVTPEGEWIERGSMGWWGIVTNETDKAEWEIAYKSILEKYKSCTAIAVDCHI